MRGQRGGIHRHAQVHRQRGGHDDQGRRILGHQLQRGELRGARDDTHRETHDLREVQPRLGSDHAEEDREGHHDDDEGKGIARTAPECLFRADRIAHREGPFTASVAGLDRERSGCNSRAVMVRISIREQTRRRGPTMARAT
jgi:hypothetical protein